MPAPATLQPPWSASWSAEQEFHLTQSVDFPGMVELDQKQAPGVGDPLFAVVHITRHRRSRRRGTTGTSFPSRPAAW
jgi:hypothetical protein